MRKYKINFMEEGSAGQNHAELNKQICLLEEMNDGWNSLGRCDCCYKNFLLQSVHGNALESPQFYLYFLARL
jgi:hypothetical protein